MLLSTRKDLPCKVVGPGPWSAWLLLFLLLLLVQAAAVAGAAASGDADELAREIAAERKRVGEAGELGDARRKELLARLDRAAEFLDRRRQVLARSEALKARVRKAPAELAELQRRRLPRMLSASALAGWSDSRLQRELDRTMTAIDRVRAELNAAEGDLARYLAAAKQDGEELVRINARLASLVGSAASTATASAASGADALQDRAELAWLQARRDFLRLRQDNLSRLTELAQAQRDFDIRLLQRLQENADLLHQALTERKVATLQQSEPVTPKEDGAQALPEVLRPLQERIDALRAEQARIVARSGELAQREEQARRQLEFLKSDRTRLQQALELVAEGDQLSAMLRKRRQLLPGSAELAAELDAYVRELNRATLRQLELDEILRSPRLENELKMSAAVSPDANAQGGEPPLSPALERQRRELEQERQQALQDLLLAYTDYVSRLSSLQATLRKLHAETVAYHDFIIAQMLWMPSSASILDFRPRLLFDGLAWYLNHDNLRSLVHDARQVAQRHPVRLLLLGLAWSILLSLRKRARQAVSGPSQRAGSGMADSMLVTLRALVDSLILILPGPLLLLGGGLLLGGLPSASDYSLRLAAGLQGAGQALLFLNLLRVLCHERGLAQVHLGWHPVLCHALHRQALWLTPLLVPLVAIHAANAAGVPTGFIYLSGIVRTEPEGVLLLGRLAFAAMMVLLGIALQRIWGRDGAVIKAFAQDDKRRTWAQYHPLWFYPVMGLPLLLLVAVLAGYDYSATFFLTRIGSVLWLFLGLLLLKDFLLHGLRLAQRRMRLQQAMQASESAAGPADNSDGEVPQANAAPVDYGELSLQVRKLVNLLYFVLLIGGLWYLMRDLLPAFGVLDRVELPITTTRLVEGVRTEVPITLGDMISGLVIGVLVLLGARSVPGLLEFTLLQRLPLSQATRYAITTVVQYLVVLLGLVVSFNAIGLQWSSIQWLVAALGVGLGFGLQEIVANFVSGLILLFEQPIRVGDLVTVGETTGVVTRIRIRATTIVNWDRQELIVPNKTFITGDLINWTLSDPINRLIIPVGVAYGTDTRQAMALMLEAAREHPRVLDDPPPSANFEEFGDNALLLTLRAYLNDVDHRLSTRTDLNQAIAERFAEAGIEIAFPQRDLHLDTRSPLELVLREEARDESAGDASQGSRDPSSA